MRPRLASTPSTEDPASAWAHDDPLSGHTSELQPTHDKRADLNSSFLPADSTQQEIPSGPTSNGQLTTSDDDSGHVKAAAAAAAPKDKTARLSEVKPPSSAAVAAIPQPPARSSSSSHSTDSSAAPSQPKSVDYNQLHALCTNGDLDTLKAAFARAAQILRVSCFALSNTPNPASGLTPVHYAAKEGRVDILKWLTEDMGALASMEDREGEVSRMSDRGEETRTLQRELTHVPPSFPPARRRFTKPPCSASSQLCPTCCRHRARTSTSTWLTLMDGRRCTMPAPEDTSTSSSTSWIRPRLQSTCKGGEEDGHRS